jgi:hypothetical protein
MSQPIVSEARVFNKPQFYYQKTAKVELSKSCPRRFTLGALLVDQFQDIPFQFSPASLQSKTLEIHLGAVAGQDEPLSSCLSISPAIRVCDVSIRPTVVEFIGGLCD